MVMGEYSVTTTNGIALKVRASAGLPYAGIAWLQVPDDGVPVDLLPQVKRYLAVHGDALKIEEPLEVMEVSWEGVRKAVEGQLARRTERAIVEATMELHVVEAWRAQAAAYVAGNEFVAEPLVDRGASAFHGLPDRRVYGKIVGQVADEEIVAVREETARREAALQDRRKQWAVSVGMSDEMVERFMVGVMPDDELTEVVANVLIPELGSISDLQVSELRGGSFKRSHRCGAVIVVGEAVEVVDSPMRALEWQRWKVVQAAAERASSQGQVKVVLMQYHEVMECGCRPDIGYTASLHLELPQVGVKVERTYSLTSGY